MRKVFLSASVALVLPLGAAPRLLDEQFNLPDGFHIYRVASPELTGGSYDLVFDGEGRLLVGDGKNLRRLTDTDGDQVYDESEVIAEGLGGRGPQGLVVYGDHVYAVGGDGIQLFSGYRAGGKLKHERRLGAPFSTGGDHAAHTVLRGLDGYIYFITGDGGGAGERKHITERSSPVLFERTASVFRFDPSGEEWECIGSGGRNPPSLGMNFLGEFFSFDSDMEWHVSVPFWRPVRLHHWATGGDQGWQGVGAFPKYYLDNLPGVLDVGRGSPTWGVFYEHTQFPAAYHDAFLVCDYQWKSATSGGYANPGRLVSFEMERDAATWKAEMSVLAQPKPDAVDGDGRKINFAVVDVDVAPDGSLLVSDHNQGVWRIFHDPSEQPAIKPIVPDWVRTDEISDFTSLLHLPQPMSEWSRLREESLVNAREEDVIRRLHYAVLEPRRSKEERLRAVRLLAPRFDALTPAFLEKMATDAMPEIRGQAAWLLGIRRKQEGEALALVLLDDPDPFVQRRAVEAFMRLQSPAAIPRLVKLLASRDRFVAYAAMTALSHHPGGILIKHATGDARINMRLLVACHLRRERPAPEVAHPLIGQLLDDGIPSNATFDAQDHLDLLRVLGLYRPEISHAEELLARVKGLLREGLNTSHPDLRWEYVRLAGEYDVASAFAPLLALLESEPDGVTQFHLAEALGRISSGWSEKESLRLVRWLLGTQTGWFAQRDGKGRQFGGFWNTVVNQLATRHAASLIQLADQLSPESEIAKVAYKAVRGAPDADKVLLRAFRNAKSDADRQRWIGLLKEVRSPLVAEVLLADLDAAEKPEEREDLIAALTSQPLPDERADLFVRALFEVDARLVVERCAARILSDGSGFDRYASSLGELTLGDWKGQQAVAFRLIELMNHHPEVAATLERTLQLLVAHQRPSFRAPLQVIWTSDQQVADERAWFAKSFELNASPTKATLAITCDNEFEAFINGRRVVSSRDWEKPVQVEVASFLRAGRNLIAVEGLNLGGPAGLAAKLKWTTESGARELSTDTTWRVASARPPKGWEKAGAADGNWRIPADVSQPTENVTKVMSPLIEQALADSPEELIEYWQVWFREEYGQPWIARESIGASDRISDGELHALLLGMKEFKGDASRGRQLYLRATCFACHGGIEGQAGSLFGPPLAGVTQRLNRQELADAIVYPSKHVPERFKASELTTTGGESINGFITEQTDEFVSITDIQNQVTRLPRSEVQEIRSQDQSLMPAGLLNALDQAEIADLMAFIHGLK